MNVICNDEAIVGMEEDHPALKTCEYFQIGGDDRCVKVPVSSKQFVDYRDIHTFHASLKSEVQTRRQSTRDVDYTDARILLTKCFNAWDVADKLCDIEKGTVDVVKDTLHYYTSRINTSQAPRILHIIMNISQDIFPCHQTHFMEILQSLCPLFVVGNISESDYNDGFNHRASVLTCSTYPYCSVESRDCVNIHRHDTSTGMLYGIDGTDVVWKCLLNAKRLGSISIYESLIIDGTARELTFDEQCELMKLEHLPIPVRSTLSYLISQNHSNCHPTINSVASFSLWKPYRMPNVCFRCLRCARKICPQSFLEWFAERRTDDEIMADVRNYFIEHDMPNFIDELHAH